MHLVTSQFLKDHGLSETFPARFFSKIEVTDSCWIWTGAMSHGYGWLNTGKHGISIFAHVGSYLLHYGEIPNGCCVCHDCPGGDNRRCVNPAHLWLGTKAQNNKDAAIKGVMHPGESHGMAKLTEQQVIDIRRIYDTAALTMTQVGRLYQISTSTAHSVIRKTHWKHV